MVMWVFSQMKYFYNILFNLHLLANWSKAQAQCLQGNLKMNINTLPENVGV